MRNIRFTPEGEPVCYVIDADTGQRLGGFGRLKAETELWGVFGINTVTRGLPNNATTREGAIDIILKHADAFPDHHVE